MLTASCSHKMKKQHPSEKFLMLWIPNSFTYKYQVKSQFHLKFSPRLKWSEWPSSEARRTTVSRSASRRSRPWKASGIESSCSLESKYDWDSLAHKLFYKETQEWCSATGQDVFSPCCRPLTVTKLESCVPSRPRRRSQAHVHTDLTDQHRYKTPPIDAIGTEKLNRRTLNPQAGSRQHLHLHCTPRKICTCCISVVLPLEFSTPADELWTLRLDPEVQAKLPCSAEQRKVSNVISHMNSEFRNTLLYLWSATIWTPTEELWTLRHTPTHTHRHRTDLDPNQNKSM